MTTSHQSTCTLKKSNFYTKHIVNKTLTINHKNVQ